MLNAMITASPAALTSCPIMRFKARWMSNSAVAAAPAEGCVQKGMADVYALQVKALLRTVTWQ
jgi:hypothetical protein